MSTRYILGKIVMLLDTCLISLAIRGIFLIFINLRIPVKHKAIRAQVIYLTQAWNTIWNSSGYLRQPPLSAPEVNSSPTGPMSPLPSTWRRPRRSQMILLSWQEKNNTLLDSRSTKPSCTINGLDRNAAKMLPSTFEEILSSSEQDQVSGIKYNNAYIFLLKF